MGPFLHNSSIANHFQFLSPREERENVFYVGHPDFNPKRVGFVLEKIDDTDFEFVMSILGNSNQGYKFRNGPLTKGVIGLSLSKPERWDLVKFLETL